MYLATELASKGKPAASGLLARERRGRSGVAVGIKNRRRPFKSPPQARDLGVAVIIVLLRDSRVFPVRYQGESGFRLIRHNGKRLERRQRRRREGAWRKEPSPLLRWCCMYMYTISFFDRRLHSQVSGDTVHVRTVAFGAC